jgi:hypothetical protein
MTMSHRFHPVVHVPEFLSRVDLACVIACLTLWVVSGCGDVAPPGPSAQPTAQARTSSLPPAIQTGPAIESAPESGPPPAPAAEPVPVAEQAAPVESLESSAPAQPRKIIGKTTTDVRDAAKEQAKGAKKVQPRITGQDPITISGNAYTVIVGRAEQLQIRHSLDLFHALNNRYPKDLQEFMKEIIKANGIRLAQLPFYQEYGYDAVKHELVILEYPDKKAQLLGGGK